MGSLIMLVTFTLYLVGAFASDNIRCLESIDKVDKCYTSIHVIGDRNFIRPKSMAAMKEHCKWVFIIHSF